MDDGWSGGASGRRSGRRQLLDRPLAVVDSWPCAAPASARVCDVSPGGLRFIAATPFERHRIVKLDCDVLSAVARVAHCRALRDAAAAHFDVGVEFFTLRLPRTSGVFLSVSG